MEVAKSDAKALHSHALSVRTWLELSKSGIVTLVLISVSGGYFIGHPIHAPLDWLHFAKTFLGILLLASGSSALNQVQEVDRDQLMQRTRSRPIPSGRISKQAALGFSLVTVALGLWILAGLGLPLLISGIAAVVLYNGAYTLWWKRKWPYAAVPGAIPGALPALMGHLAASDSIAAPGGVYLFSLLFIWQMPHFWVLAIKYQADYAEGGFPVLPVARGNEITLQQILLWALAYIGLALIAPLFLPTGKTYLLMALPTCAWIAYELVRYVQAASEKAWIRFFLAVNFSLIVFIAAAAIDLWLPRL